MLSPRRWSQIMTKRNSVLLILGPASGGIGVHVSSLAQNLPEAGWAVSVLTAPETASRFEFGESVSDIWPSRLSLRSVLKLRHQLGGILKDFSVVHAHGHQAGFLAMILLGITKSKVPLVISWHNATLGSGPKKWIRDIIASWQARKAQLVAGASTDLVNSAIHLGAKKSILAAVAAPAAGSSELSRGAARTAVANEFGITTDHPLILTVARIAPQKNLETLIAAAARVSKNLSFNWLIIGSGDKETLERLTNLNQECNSPVMFIGERDDVPILLAAADLFVLTSQWEARALVVQEAMAAGVPTIATNVGGLPDLLQGAGELVEPGDVLGLSNAVSALLADPIRARALGAAGRERFAELPTEHDVVIFWGQTYAKLLSKV